MSKVLNSEEAEFLEQLDEKIKETIKKGPDEEILKKIDERKQYLLTVKPLENRFSQKKKTSLEQEIEALLNKDRKAFFNALANLAKPAEAAKLKESFDQKSISLRKDRHGEPRLQESVKTDGKWKPRWIPKDEEKDIDLAEYTSIAEGVLEYLKK